MVAAVTLPTRRAWGKKIILAAMLVYALMGSYTMADPLQNGDFSDGLVGWDYDVVTLDGEVAVLGEDPGWFAWLEQEFTIIPDHALSLSFDYRPGFQTDETFNAYLLDASSLDPLIPTDADPSDLFESFYFEHDWVWGVLTDPAYVKMTALTDDWSRVTLDLTSLNGTGATPTQVLLAFDYIGLDPDYDGKIEIDNVTYVPVFSSALLGAIGLSTVAALRRKRKDLLP